MQQELEQVQKEREILENQRRVLKAVAPSVASVPASAPAAAANANTSTTCVVLCDGWRLQQQQHHHHQQGVLGLQQELDAKLLENCDLRGQVERYRKALERWEARAMELEQKLRAQEAMGALSKNKVASEEAEQQHQQQTMAVLRHKYAEAQDELEEMRALIEDQAGHLEGYRNKYLAAQQQVEEQRRQMDQLEAEQDRLADQVQAEMHRVKAEFEGRLQELAPLPDILKATQAKLQDEKQLRLIAERDCADLNHDLSAALDRVASLEKDVNAFRAQQQSWADERQSLLSQVEAYENKSNQLRDEISWYKQGMVQLEQAGMHGEKLFESTAVELSRVRAELEAGREQAERQASRMREQADTVRRSLQSQIAELEQQLACSRASAAAAHKDKEELQQRLQKEISSITRDFGQAQDRIKNLQTVVDFLKDNIMDGKVVNRETLPMDFQSKP